MNEFDDLKIDLGNLPTGDYLINNKWLFERKTLSDFGSSIIDGRLFKQALNLISTQFRPVLILEGSHEDFRHLKMSRESLQGALIKLSIIFKIPVLRAKDIKESVQLMLYVAKQFNGLTESSLLKKRKIIKGKRRTQINILQSLPGIGYKRAKWLLERFGTVSAVIQAELLELEQAPGIGRKTAERIHWAIK